jgi:hypothetical protein
MYIHTYARTCYVLIKPPIHYVLRICMYVRMYECMCVGVCVFVCLCVRARVCVCACVFVCVCVRLFILYVCAYITYIYIGERPLVYVYVYVCVFT